MTAPDRSGAMPDDAATPPPADDAPAELVEGLAASGAAAPHRSRSMAHLASGETFSVAEALGGPRGVLESAVPGVVFVVVYSLAKDLSVAAYAAVAVAGVLAVARLVRREPLYPALSGLLGVAICAAVARGTGRAEDFFVFGFFINIFFAVAYAVSIAVRWPLLGLMVGPILDEGLAWRKDPPRLRAYMQASAIWVVLFVVRLVVQVPLYFANRRCRDSADPTACAAEALGFLASARVVMGVPLFALAAYLSWLILRRVPPTRPAVTADA